MNIRSRLTLMIIVLLNAVIIITGLFSYSRSTDIISNLIKNSAIELTKSHNQMISELIEKEINLQASLASDSNVLALLTDQSNQYKIDTVNKLMIKYAENKPNLIGVFLNNTVGISLATNNTSEVGMVLSDRNYHKRTVAAKASVISETLQSRFQGSQIFVATYPVFSPKNGEFLGYIASAIRSDSMAVNLKGMKLNGADSSYAYLIDENGNIIYHPDTKKIGHPVENPEIREIMTKIQDDGKSSPAIVRYSENGQDMIGACSLIARTKWMLVIVGNMNEFEAPIKSLTTVIIVFGVLITIITSIVGYFLARQISNPIIKSLESKNEELTALYEEISASEEELHEQLNELNEHRATILEMAYHDSLTQLANRALFIEHLNECISISEHSSSKFAIAFLDLDNFKRINDTLGHSIGNELLVSTSKRLMNGIGDDDFIARLSGDEFSIVLSNIESTDEITPYLDKIMEQFNEPFDIKNKTINLTVSIGISVFPKDGTTVEELLKNADTAMYKSKEMGKNTYQFFTESMKSELLRKTELERMLRKAMENEELSLVYQPQYSADTVKLRGLEALLRWNSSELGPISPMEFIPIAEETGLIVPIGAWVLKTACMMCSKIITEYHAPIIMSVNISAVQIKHPHFYETVMECINSSGIDPKNLDLEVTESVFIGNEHDPYSVLWKLKESGIGLAMDDFGTGYSSLSYLRLLPISLLKIDKSFVQEIGRSSEKNGLTEAIISLAQKLNIETLAEGVETKEQLDYLAKSGCDYLQGYYLSLPLKESQIGELIENTPLDNS
ncbi:MAG TPA: EAL domain-containing protein [Clostridia bacterium]|nr:EAL domain-containing protein [Clostridia bacterium]